MNDLISRKALIAEYDRLHIGPPGGARKLMEEAPAVQQWIPVTERLPQKEDAKVIDGYIIGILKGRKPNIMRWVEVASYPHYFTHWMPLPEPPKGE